MAINKKGMRKIKVNNILFYYKCKTHERTLVYREDTNEFFNIWAANSGECNQMSLPSVVSSKILECYFDKE